jgi:hypothetical protein
LSGRRPCWKFYLDAKARAAIRTVLCPLPSYRRSFPGLLAAIEGSMKQSGALPPSGKFASFAPWRL